MVVVRGPVPASRRLLAGGRSADMDDILILTSRHSQAASLWVSYLTRCFEEITHTRKKPPYKILNLGVEDIASAGNVSLAMEEKMVRVKLQIVIVCPLLLDELAQLSQQPQPAALLGRLLQPDRALAMLLGVTEDLVTDQHRAALVSFDQWHRMQVKDQDESFVGDFLKLALTILGKVTRQQMSKEKALFSVIPKKVNEGQSKVILLLNDPIEKEDQIKIKVDKNGEFLEVLGVKKRNPYTLYFQMPESCLEVSMLVSVHVEKNGHALGNRQIKCESRMRELDQLLRTSDSPLEFMCQTLGFSPGDRDHLDNFMLSAFQRNLPPHFNLLQTPTVAHQHRTHASPEEYPTLLHFAARFGLEKLAWQLLECPGGEQACEIRNVCDMTPAEMAEAANHSKLANVLRGYMQMTEFTSMYSYLKIMSEGNHKNKGLNENEYHRPRPLSETYQVPPSSRTLVEQNYQIPPAARPYTPSSPPQSPSNGTEGYMEMHPASTSTPNFSDNLDFLNAAATTAKSSDTLSDRSISPSEKGKRFTSQSQLDQMSLEAAHDEKLLQTGVGIKKSTEQINQGVQDELLEIINDFKNNVFTISEVEKLVENWKNRNDVQQSFREKQDQLNQMREEYERLQQHMKEHLKRPTPFERVRMFFKGKPKGKHKEGSPDSSSSNASESTKQPNSEFLPACHRPVSSLSLHSISSSSSGRMSTLSGCSGTSVGDSGTHSDTDDRKLCSPFDFHKPGFLKGMLQNYEIPPAPRPFYQGSHLSSNLSSCIKSSLHLENRPPLPAPRPETDDIYVIPEVSQPTDIESRRSGDSMWSETEERIDAIVSSKSTTDIKPTNGVGEKQDVEYLSLENGEKSHDISIEQASETLNNNEYMNIVYSKEEAKRTDYVVSDATDGSDMREYVNVSIPSAPPVPPRVPLKKM